MAGLAVTSGVFAGEVGMTTITGVAATGFTGATILAATTLGAAGAVVGAGAALVIKKNLVEEETNRPDRTSQYLDRELYIFGSENSAHNDVFDSFGVTLEFDDVGDDFLVQHVSQTGATTWDKPVESSSSSSPSESEGVPAVLTEGNKHDLSGEQKEEVPLDQALKRERGPGGYSTENMGIDYFKTINKRSSPTVSQELKKNGYRKPRFVARGWYSVPISPEAVQSIRGRVSGT